MGHEINSSSLLKKVINNTNAKNKVLKINSLAGVMRFAKISQSPKTPRLPENETDRFYFSILREQFREIKFYHQQVVQSSDMEIARGILNRNKRRLNLALMAMNMTTTSLKETILTDFFKSIDSNETCWNIIVSTLADSANQHGEFFKRLLEKKSRNNETDKYKKSKL